MDTTKAEKLPGVKAVLTGSTIPPFKFGVYKDNPPLKAGKVCSLRDEIAAVAAVSPEVAQEALDLIEVEYEELPAIFDPIAAMKEGAPLIHEEHKTNVLKMPWKLATGDVESAKKEAAYVVEDTFRTQWVTHCCLGASGCIASFDINHNLTMYSNTQIPYLAQKDFMEALGTFGLKNKKVRIIQSVIGGGFGSKLDTYAYEYIAILLALKTRKPVKILFSREEEFFATSPRQCTITKISQGCDQGRKAPLQGDGDDPRQWRLYLMGRNNPVRYDAAYLLSLQGAEREIRGQMRLHEQYIQPGHAGIRKSPGHLCH